MHLNQRRRVVAVVGEDVVDVVADAFAEIQDRLLPAVHDGKPVGHRGQLFDHRARVVLALLLIDVHRIHPDARRPYRRVVDDVVDLVQDRRPRLRAAELVDGREQQALVVREFLARIGSARGAARGDDGHEIVRAELVADEFLRGQPHQVRVLRQRVRRIEHHDVHAAGEDALVRLDVGFDRLAREQRLLAALDRNVDRHEVRQRLRFAVLEDLEVFLLEIPDVVSLRVGHEHVDFDVVDGHAEGRRLRSGLLPSARLSTHDRQAEQHHRECHGGDA